MRSKLVIMSAAALLAGTSLALGQGATERKGQTPPGTSQPSVTQGQPAQPKSKGVQGVQKEEQRPAQKEEQRPSTSGQAPAAQGQNPREKAEPRTPSEKAEPRTLSQAQREQNQNRTQGQSQREQGQTRAPNQNQPGANQPAQNQPGQTQGQNERSGGASVTLSTEQRTKVRQTVVEGRSAPRVDRVDFSLNVGTVVPRTVRVVEVPETIIEIRPEWRGYRYFVYKEEIIIVDPSTLRIVAVIEV
jgi:hypothetical protein